MKNSFLMLVCFGFLLPVFSTVGQADSGLDTGGKLMAYADKLFDNSRVHRIDVRLSDADLSGLLADPISRTEYAADIVIDGETFSDVVFSTKGFSSLYFVAYGEEESRRYSFEADFGKLVKDQTYYGLDSLSLNNIFADYTWMKDLISYQMFRDVGVEALASYLQEGVD